MEEHGIAGAAVSVVKDGQLFFAKGYGYADIENGIPVDPEQTIFRIGSVGKLFTWTAVMQLVEQGKLDLDADINTYLDFRIPDTYPQPITLKHLLTHTPGFEDRWFGSAWRWMPVTWCRCANGWSPICRRECARPAISRRTRTTMHLPGGVHRGAGIGPALRAVHPGKHPGPIGHGALNRPFAGAAGPARPCIRGIHVRRWRLPGFSDYLGQPAMVPAAEFTPASRTWPVS
jgi:hypothetical protein